MDGFGHNIYNRIVWYYLGKIVKKKTKNVMSNHMVLV